ncbi:MAG: molybdopterin molybdotransferase MoeA [Pseudomonadales bacterium]|nr:molybdopterin molybdotransferase MoeA [Pseudomonadales bacterium]MCP5345056.1 molybdopterin molybdotransferase MoeA [Pseudomonadales bacterium]
MNATQTLTPIDQALKQILAGLRPVIGSERVALEAALHRVLARPLRATIDVPGYDNSGMDGYALNSQSLARGQLRFPVSQRIAAGHMGSPLMAGTAARIFTGAPIPPGADAVVMQENCRVDGDFVEILQTVYAGENVRRAGADVAVGEQLFPAGHRLRAPDLGLLASVGTLEVEVRRPLRVALLTTGDELVRPGQRLQPGQIYNSNFYMVSGMLRELGHEVIDCGIVQDNLQATREALLAAAQTADCIISSGGVSVGEEDHVRHAVEDTGRLAFWKLAIKPGKPFAFGEVGDTPFFGLPGNPVSSFINFALVVRPCLERLAGGLGKPALPLSLPVDFERPLSGIRQEYLRVRCISERGQLRMQLTGDQSSGVLSSVSHCDGLAVVPAQSAVRRGDVLRFLPLSAIVGLD